MCSSDNLACLALTMCPDLEKLRSDVALLEGMQRYFRAACAMIGYLRRLGPILEGAHFGGGVSPSRAPPRFAPVQSLRE